MKLELLLDNTAQFTELIRITNFTNIEECLQIINKHFLSPHELATAEPEDLFYTDDQDGKEYKYCHIAGDGNVSFVVDLNEYSEGYTSEQKWNVVSSTFIN